AIRRAAAGSDKPVLTCFIGTHGIPPALSSLHEGRIPSYTFPEAAAIALSRAVRYGQWLAQPEGDSPELRDLDPARARAVVSRAAESGTEWLGPDEISELFASYGIRTLQSRFAADAASAVRHAGAIGFPVAVKLASETITHKSDVGGVILDVRDEAEVAAAFERIRTNLADRGIDPQQMSGVTVQEIAGRGIETFIGMTREGAFGPLIAFGIGGTLVEIWRDILFRIAPLTDRDAREMVHGIRAAKLLDGFRGSPPADREAIIDTLLRISRMALDHPEIHELDINPLVARRPGEGAIAVDARVRIETPSPG
ncbi:MAG TPA: acetate--CoA ligase family protein, partial [Thermoanaerobaculia bacterium]|nr:acetate--CoA ligase family protein [Thermoanaerobaculia bacterium]